MSTIQWSFPGLRGLLSAGPQMAIAAAASLPGRFFSLFMGWQERAEQRRTLQQLDDHMLRDLGLSRADVAREADKPVWRA